MWRIARVVNILAMFVIWIYLINIYLLPCLGQLGHLELWYLVIPGFCLFGLLWAICHIILLITIWGFHTKLTECQKAWRAHPSSRRSLDQVMASRGIRHFCLISERLVFFSLLSTVILGAVSWQVSYRLKKLLHFATICMRRCLWNTPMVMSRVFVYITVLT